MHDDYNAVYNAHEYANRFGCEVRATVGGPNAGAEKGKTYHIFNYYSTKDLIGYTSVDWQNATVVIHDENIDDYPARFSDFIYLYPSPLTKPDSAYAKSTSVANNKATVSASKVGGVWQSLFSAGALCKATTSINGLNAEIDAKLASLHTKGHDRFFVQAYNADKKQFARHETGNTDEGYEQWDGFIVDYQGNIEKLNSGKMTASGLSASVSSGSE